MCWPSGTRRRPTTQFARKTGCNARQSSVLQVRDLAVEVGGRYTLTGATMTLRAGDKVGLVGRNGVGKTSLMKVLAGDAPAASGVVARTGAIGFLSQEPPPRGKGVDGSALAHVLSARGLDVASQRLEQLHERMAADASPRNVRAYSDAEDAFRHAGGYAAESEVRRIASGLGLGNDRLDLPVTALSGGERRRVDLTRILFAGSDLLLLDEPTNHLDIDAKQWLMQFLRSYRGGLLVISHDLELLDQAITRVLHIDNAELIEYRGTYSQYLVARATDAERRTKIATRQTAEIDRLRALADSMRGQTETRARKAKTLDHRVEKLQATRVTKARAERTLRVRLP